MLKQNKKIKFQDLYLVRLTVFLISNGTLKRKINIWDWKSDTQKKLSVKNLTSLDNIYEHFNRKLKFWEIYSKSKLNHLYRSMKHTI